ncbi:glutathione S-transferase family protein [Sphingomonas sp. CROZ-RG-20F-R02-07]|uniref:glutathione S-transferase family protein n=1 Tax=Sphingomonas sp. CROZ-RG-20F-R02-07 TaxID=2914832 RepID=UPI001F5A8256|nr:glutathione S-transferase family protein [Sphingomonas sp. CROZ-RG-20F-R02-07]
MLTLHHLAFSRSQRVLWLIEELGLSVELVRYDRTPEFRSPPELKKVHPLGKSPVIQDGDLTLAESATILRYLDGCYGANRFSPAPDTTEHAIHEEWLDFVESTAAGPLLTVLLSERTGEQGAGDRARPMVGNVLSYIANGLGDKPFLMGERPMLADMQMSYFLAMARMAKALHTYPTLTAYLDRLEAQPGFQRAQARGGPMLPAALP